MLHDDAVRNDRSRGDLHHGRLTTRLSDVLSKYDARPDTNGVRVALASPSRKFGWEWSSPKSLEQYFIASTTTLYVAAMIMQCERVPAAQFVSLIALLVAWSGLTFGLLTAIDNFSVQVMDNWLPRWSLPAHLIGDPDQYSKSAFALTVFLRFLLNGFAGPIVEELYFRGYLLPRTPAGTHWAPLINVPLFSASHFFSPWQNATRIIGFAPLVYVVAWKRNIRIGMWADCLTNTLGMIQALVALL